MESKIFVIKHKNYKKTKKVNVFSKTKKVGVNLEQIPDGKTDKHTRDNTFCKPGEEHTRKKKTLIKTSNME